MDLNSKDTLLRILQFGLVLVILLLIWPFVMPIALAFVFASLLWPYARAEWRFVKSKALRAAILTVGFVTLIIGPVLSLIGAGVFVLQKKIQEGALEQIDLQPGHWMRDLLSSERVEKIQAALNIDDEQLRSSLIAILQKAQGVVLNFLQSILTGAPAAVMAFIIMIFCLFWILKDQNQIEAWLYKHSPMKRKETLHLVDTFRMASVAVVMAGILSGATQATIIGIGAAVSGLGNPWVAATIVFFASFFPFLGSGLVSISLIVIGVATQDVPGVLLFLPFAGISSVADNIIYPLVVGGRGEINPFISFLAVIGGIQLFGIFGIFLGPIVFILCLRTLSLLSGDPIPEIAPDELPPKPWRDRLRESLPEWLARRIPPS